MPDSRESRRFNFTLKELFVVIAVIGGLLALLLVNLQASRESARRLDCSNNLKQQALGLLMHHDTFKRFPPGCANNVRPSFGTRGAGQWGASWMIYIRPYVEQSSIFSVRGFSPMNQQYDSAGIRADIGDTAGSPIIDEFHCPSSPMFEKHSPSKPHSQIADYMGIAGCTNTLGGTPPQTWELEYRNSGSYGQHSNSGILGYNTKTRHSDITDGAAFTMTIAECGQWGWENTNTKRDFRPGYQYGFAMGCLGGGSGSNRIVGGTNGRPFNTTTVRYTVNLGASRNSSNSIWNTSCIDGVCQNMGANHPIQSAHPGGALAAFADGSVYFIHETTTIRVLARMAHKADGFVVELPKGDPRDIRSKDAYGDFDSYSPDSPPPFSPPPDSPPLDSYSPDIPSADFDIPTTDSSATDSSTHNPDRDTPKKR